MLDRALDIHLGCLGIDLAFLNIDLDCLNIHLDSLGIDLAFLNIDLGCLGIDYC